LSVQLRWLTDKEYTEINQTVQTVSF